MTFQTRNSGPWDQDSGTRPAFRKPRRISVTVPDQTYRQILECSNRQGRSVSNLAAFLLEMAIASEQKDCGSSRRAIQSQSSLLPARPSRST
ncbi:hypothetical protein KBY75_01795 [Cyanobium sp. T1G-Tous]|uniref:ribbon-helix-helix domain-containing protein n=1 Tax=unclassified Cyanobium TaxID=2627006 RepID=UPI0020CE1394|nr:MULTISPECIES: hypothetical protein [unclassified Cyanobium]MCP9777314.1 hypothetical protein [Cyanobium sp. Tous-M-B4]MCP9802297.1 hypothetical protein [Cyanobium sp. T1G-Tous]MCP9875687.1 hypothetical protein [Cyanobium sp. A2C-AMD]